MGRYDGEDYELGPPCAPGRHKFAPNGNCWTCRQGKSSLKAQPGGKQVGPNGVCTGDIVTDADGNKVIVVGFLTTHPDSDEVKMVWPGGGIQKDDGPWPPGGRLTAESIGLETRSAKEKYRNQVLRALL